VSAAGLGLAVLAPRRLWADEVSVPVLLQAELLVKLVVYDRNFDERAGTRVKTLIVVKDGDPASKKVSGSMKEALGQFGQIGRRPHDEISVKYDGAAALAKQCKQHGAAIVYLPPGLESETAKVGKALRGVDVLSVAAVPTDVVRGVVLGFDLISGKPKLLVNLEQAKQQNVNFKAEVLKLMKVYR
jgi:hypothetical protein